MKKRSLLVSLFVGFALALIMPMTATAQSADESENGAETLQVDGTHSSVVFRANYADVGYVFGQFGKVSGTIKYHPDDVSKSSIELEVPVKSVETFSDKRNKHLQSKDFFLAKQFPNITFKSTEVERKDDNTLSVTGELTIRGKTEELTLDVKELGSGPGTQGKFRRGFYTEFNINRMNYGVDWQPKPGAVGEQIHIYLAIQGIRK